MPVHLSSFVPENKSDAVFADLVSMTNRSSVVCASKDKRYLHLQKDLMDAVKGEPFGRVVFTIKIDDETKSLNIIDVDIVLENDRTTELELITKLSQSSDANEYYDADVVDGGRIQIETVNRYAFHGELEGVTHSFRLSAFPFAVDVFNSMDEINKRFNLNSSVKVEEEEMKVWIAYELIREMNLAERVYRYNRGLMERKNKDGSWHEERAALCIFCGEDLDYEEITEKEANEVEVEF